MKLPRVDWRRFWHYYHVHRTNGGTWAEALRFAWEFGK